MRSGLPVPDDRPAIDHRRKRPNCSNVSDGLSKLKVGFIVSCTEYGNFISVSANPLFFKPHYSHNHLGPSTNARLSISKDPSLGSPSLLLLVERIEFFGIVGLFFLLLQL